MALCCDIEAGAVNFLDSDGQVCVAQMVPELILMSELTFPKGPESKVPV